MLDQCGGIQPSEESVQTVVTPPPDWSLRDYGASGQLGISRISFPLLPASLLLARFWA